MKRWTCAFTTTALMALGIGCSQPAPVTKALDMAPFQNRENASQPIARTTAPSSNFDFYLLNLSWSPEYCLSHPTATECAQHSAFVLHGLWPERLDGTYPENCSNAPGPSNPAKYADIYPDPGLLKHEWRTHGTCSGLTADAFFTQARAAKQSIKIPQELSEVKSQILLTPDQIKAEFQGSNPGLPAGDIAISCGNNYLTAVEVCLDNGLHPTSCGAVKSCRANTVKIPAP